MSDLGKCILLCVSLSIQCSAYKESGQTHLSTWINKTEEGSQKNYTTTAVPQGITNQTIVFRGLNGIIAKFTRDFTKDNAVFEIYTSQPHVYFNNHLYMYLKVKDQEGEIKFEKRINGIGENITSHIFSLKPKDTVEIYHQEMWRVESDDVNVRSIRRLNTYLVTKYGLQNMAVNIDPQLIFALKVYKFGELIWSDKNLCKRPIELSTEKQAFINFVLLLEEQYYKSFIPVAELFCNCSYIQLIDDLSSEPNRNNNLVNLIAKENYIFAEKYVDNAYNIINYIPQIMTKETIVFNGLNGRIAIFIKDLTEDYAFFDIYSTEPHVYYKNNLYMYIKVKNPKGAIKFEKIINGIGEKITSHEFSLELNDTVEIFHQEMWRVASDEIEINRNSTLNIYNVTQYGLQNLALETDLLLKYISKLYQFGQSIVTDDKLPIELSADKQGFINLVMMLEEQHRESLVPLVENICACSFLDLEIRAK